MTETSNFKKIFDEITQSDVHVVGKVNFYNLTAHLEKLYLQNQELKERIEALEKSNLSVYTDEQIQEWNEEDMGNLPDGFFLSQQEIEELRKSKKELTEYARKKLKAMNNDFLKDYPDVTRVEVITDSGREFVRYECSKVQVSLQDNGRTIKVFLSSKEN
jgi:FMN phosphatase YigB (HAD superfamily)